MTPRKIAEKSWTLWNDYYKDGNMSSEEILSELEADIEALRQQSVSAGCGLEVFSQDYLEWVKQANLSPLTNAQYKFAEWLLLKDNAKVIAQIGDLDTIFYSVRKWLKNGM